MITNKTLTELLQEVRACQACSGKLPFAPKPTLRASTTARLLIVGQAPGLKVQQTGIPWNDKSGDRLRDWLGVSRDFFYDERHIAIIPMGLCYPGKGPSGDLPPRRECAELWLEQLLAHLSSVCLTLLIGQYAQAHYLGANKRNNLTATVAAWRDYLPHYFPLPHPSPRNTYWIKQHAWFEKEVIPALRNQLSRVFETPT